MATSIDLTGEGKYRICVTGVSEFIGAHLAKRLKEEGHYIVGCDWKRNEHMQEEIYCNKFIQTDLRRFDNCRLAVRGCDYCFNFAYDFERKHVNSSTHFYNSLTASFNLIEACRVEGIARYFKGSSLSAHLSSRVDFVVNSEKTGNDAQSLKILVVEELCRNYQDDFGIQTRSARIENAYGPLCEWKGSDVSIPVAVFRTMITNVDTFRSWPGDEEYIPLLYIDDCVEGIIRAMQSEDTAPISIVSDERITFLELKRTASIFAEHKAREQRIDEYLDRQQDREFFPSIFEGLRCTFNWVSDQLNEEQTVLRRVAQGAKNCSRPLELGPGFSVL